jgi:hypothetical protein
MICEYCEKIFKPDLGNKCLNCGGAPTKQANEIPFTDKPIVELASEDEVIEHNRAVENGKDHIVVYLNHVPNIQYKNNKKIKKKLIDHPDTIDFIIVFTTICCIIWTIFSIMFIIHSSN